MMEQEMAQHMLEEGGTLVILGMPAGTEFGIDLNSWHVGDRFKGVKMIPPGLHFVYFSAVSRQGDTAPRTGFFHMFSPREMVVRHYDPALEDLKAEEEDAEEVERLRANLRELDRHLGAYPLDSWSKWISFTQHVEAEELQRILPLSGRICSVAELTPALSFRSSRSDRASTSHPPGDTTSPPSQNSNTSHTCTDPSNTSHTCTGPSNTSHTCTVPGNTSHICEDPSNTSHTCTDPSNTSHTCTDLSNTSHTCTDPSNSSHTCQTTPSNSDPRMPKDADNLPQMVPREGTEFRFTKIPSKAYREGAPPSEVTRYSLDSSYTLRSMVAQMERPESVLAELQVAFVSFLVGQVWGGWEQWRALVGVLCRAEEALLDGPELFNKFLSVLHYQVKEIPEDLFVDIVESSNFLASALTTLFANVQDNVASLPPSLVTKAQRFKAHLTARFHWDLSLADEGEDAPVVVET